jgi:two-component system NtrC family sensor kinase
MRDTLEHILLVENDLEISDLILRGALQPLGYQVSHVESASEAIQAAIQNNPDLIIADLDLPDLSGKDLLVALVSQGIKTPMIVLAKEGMDSDIIQTFRLGASDYIYWPFREAEVLSAVERLLKQVRSKRDRELLAEELDKTNQELQRRLKELKTILAIGKTVTSTKRQSELFEKVVEGAIYVAEADAGWLLIRDEDGDDFILRAQMNLPRSYKSRMNHVWNDSLNSLVALSKESLEIHGEPLKRFTIAQLGQAVLVVPLKIRNEVAGLLIVIRKAANPFSKNNQALLEAVADYASISLINVKLFQALEARAKSLEKTAEAAKISKEEKEAILRTIDREVRGGMMVAVGYIDMIVDGQLGELNEEQLDALHLSQSRLKEVVSILEKQVS